MNVNKPTKGADRTYLRSLGRALLIFLVLFWIGASFTRTLPSELQLQAQLAGLLGGIVATIAYNLVMLLLMMDKPPLTTDLDLRRRVGFGVMAFNIVMVILMITSKAFWPSPTSLENVIGFYLISPELLTPDLMLILQLIGVSFFGAGTYKIMTAMMGIQNFLPESSP